MRNQMEERIEQLENVIMDLVDVLGYIAQPSQANPQTAVESLSSTLRSIGMNLRMVGQQMESIWPPSLPATTLAPNDALERVRVWTNEMLDRRNGVT